MFLLIFCSLCAQKFWCVRTFLEMTKTCQPRTLIHHNVSVRSKFMRVRSLWKLCARAHAASLEGTLVTYCSQKFVLFNFRGDNARVFQRVSMNLNMTVGQAACQLLCQYTQGTLAASCDCWIVPIVTCNSI